VIAMRSAARIANPQTKSPGLRQGFRAPPERRRRRTGGAGEGGATLGRCGVLLFLGRGGGRGEIRFGDFGRLLRDPAEAVVGGVGCRERGLYSRNCDVGAGGRALRNL